MKITLRKRNWTSRLSIIAVFLSLASGTFIFGCSSGVSSPATTTTSSTTTTRVSTSTTSSTTTTTLRTISGRLYRWKDTQLTSLDGVAIYCEGVSTETNSSGDFQFNNVDPGPQYLTVPSFSADGIDFSMQVNSSEVTFYEAVPVGFEGLLFQKSSLKDDRGGTAHIHGSYPDGLMGQANNSAGVVSEHIITSGSADSVSYDVPSAPDDGTAYLIVTLQTVEAAQEYDGAIYRKVTLLPADDVTLDIPTLAPTDFIRVSGEVNSGGFGDKLSVNSSLSLNGYSLAEFGQINLPTISAYDNPYLPKPVDAGVTISQNYDLEKNDKSATIFKNVFDIADSATIPVDFSAVPTITNVTWNPATKKLDWDDYGSGEYLYEVLCFPPDGSPEPGKMFFGSASECTLPAEIFTPGTDYMALIVAYKVIDAIDFNHLKLWEQTVQYGAVSFNPITYPSSGTARIYRPLSRGGNSSSSLTDKMRKAFKIN